MKLTPDLERAIRTAAAAIADSDAELPEALESFGFEPVALITHRASEDQATAWLMHRLASFGVDVESPEELRIAFATVEAIQSYGSAQLGSTLSPLAMLMAVALMTRALTRRLT